MDIRRAVGVTAGIETRTLDALEQHALSPAFTPREQAALAYADAIVRGEGEVSESCLAGLRQHFSDAEIVELTAIVGYQCFASAFARGLRVTSQHLAA